MASFSQNTARPLQPPSTSTTTLPEYGGSQSLYRQQGTRRSVGGSVTPSLFASSSWGLPTMASSGTPMGSPSPSPCKLRHVSFDECLFEIKQRRKSMLEVNNSSSARAANRRQGIQTTTSRNKTNNREQEKIELSEISDHIPEGGIEAVVFAFAGMEEEEEEEEENDHHHHQGSTGTGAASQVTQQESDTQTGRNNERSLSIRTPTAPANRSWGNSWGARRSSVDRTKTPTSEKKNEPRLSQIFVRKSSFETGTFRLALGSEAHLKTALTNVKEIRLSKCNLRKVPPELFQLPALSSLDLSHNCLEELPDTFWECTSLRRLELQCDDHSAASSNRSKISPDRELIKSFQTGRDFRQARKSTLPVFPPPTSQREQCELPQLTYVDISGCGVQRLTAQMRLIPSLHTLKASSNQISYLPEELSSLKRLCIAEVENNPLCSISPSLSEKPGLELITGIPTEILPGLYLGDLKSAKNSRSLSCRHIKRIISVIESEDAVVQPGRDTLVLDVKDNPTENLGFSDCWFPYFARFCLLPKSDTPSPSLLGLVAAEDDVRNMSSWNATSSGSNKDRREIEGKPLDGGKNKCTEDIDALWERCGLQSTYNHGQSHLTVPHSLPPTGANPEHTPNIELHISNRNLSNEADEEPYGDFPDNFFGGEPVLIHCRAGVSRSATLAIAMVMLTRKQPLLSAFLHVKQRRGSISPNLGFYKQLVKFEDVLLQNGILSSLHNDFHSKPDRTTAFPSMSVQEYLNLSSSLITADVWEARYGHRDTTIKFGAASSESNPAKLRSSKTFGDGVEYQGGVRPPLWSSETEFSGSEDGVMDDAVGIASEDTGNGEESPPPSLVPANEPVGKNEEFGANLESAPFSAPFSASTPPTQGEDFGLGIDSSAAGTQGEDFGLGIDSSAAGMMEESSISPNAEDSIKRRSTTMSTAWLFESDSTTARHSSSMLLPPPVTTSWWQEVSRTGGENEPSFGCKHPSKLEIQPSHISFFVWQSDGNEKPAFAKHSTSASNRFLVNDTAQKLLMSNISRHKLTETEAARLLSVATPAAGGTGYFGVRNPYAPYNSMLFGGLRNGEEKTSSYKKSEEQNVNEASYIASRNVRKVTSLMNLNSLDDGDEYSGQMDGHDAVNGGNDEQGDRLRLLLRPSLMYSSASHNNPWKQRGRRKGRRHSFGI